MLILSGVIEERITVRGTVTVTGFAKGGADVLPGGSLHVQGAVGSVTVADSSRFFLAGAMAESLAVDLDASVWLAGIFQGKLVEAPEGVWVSEGALLRVGSTVGQVTAGRLQPAPAHIETLTVSPDGPWYQWFGDWEITPRQHD
jgi:hypothetical protein